MPLTTLTANVDQAELDELARRLAPLNIDELVVAIVNSRIERSSSAMLAIISFLDLVATLSMQLEETDRNMIASSMHDIADRIGVRTLLH